MRRRRRRDARDALEEAQAEFTRLEAVVWAGKAVAELGRIGGRAASPSELTDAERRIAEQVAAGLSNKEVAAALFLSVSTVEAALWKVYRKLDVRSRTQLAARLAQRRGCPANGTLVDVVFHGRGHAPTGCSPRWTTRPRRHPMHSITTDDPRHAFRSAVATLDPGPLRDVLTAVAYARDDAARTGATTVSDDRWRAVVAVAERVVAAATAPVTLQLVA